MLHEYLEDGINNKTLDSIYEIDEVLLKISENNDKVVYFKGQKQYYHDKIATEVEKLDQQNEQYRQLVLNTLKKHDPDTKTFQFPGIGKVQRREGKSSWEIGDENNVISALINLGVDKNELVKVKESVDRRVVKKYMESFIEQNENITGATMKQGQESISITFDDSKSKPKAKGAASVPKTEDAKPKAELRNLDL